MAQPTPVAADSGIGLISSTAFNVVVSLSLYLLTCTSKHSL